ncbi:branched-chain amino acid transaminase [Pendulispora albinea]|uniref:Branched-chain-amino-acid aminotransferase n=1 Tax=Pendulispora albinea TaxID=2741071 RepID=A0ABZ2LPU0_9BACT
MVEKLKKIWCDGEFVDWDAATIHVLTHSLHYGIAAWDGVRAYQRKDGASYVFRLREHIDRLFDSCKLCLLKPAQSPEAIFSACVQTLRVNGMVDGYLRPMVYVGDGAMGVYAPDNTIHSTIMAWRWAAHLGADANDRGIRAKISSFARPHPASAVVKAKITGQYTNSALARAEVKHAGYDEAIHLAVDGYVSEASGSNVFLAKRGVLYTPDLASAILEGVTRDTVIVLARELGMTVVEGRVTREQLWLADEVFLTGTAAEIVPVREIDDRRIGDGHVGAITRKLQERYADITRGSDTSHPEWLTRVGA